MQQVASAVPTKSQAISLGDIVFAAVARLSGMVRAAAPRRHHRGALPWRTAGVSRLRAGFLITDDWDPVQDIYGAAVPIFGTVVTSILALALAVPLAFGIAFYLTELAPVWLRRSGQHGGRVAGGGAVHHLWHVGILRDRADHGAIHPTRR